MGSELFIEVIGPDIAVLDAALDAAVAEIRRIEDLMTDWRASPLMDLNAAAGKGPQPASEEILRIVRQSQEIHEYTEGAFDITFAAVGRLWDFKKRPPVIPSPEAIAAALPYVDASRLKVDLAAGTIEIPEGMSIGLGGIAQGYAADRMMQIIMDRGIRHAMVNVSGDLKVLGRKRGELWKIAIKHPREGDKVIALLPISNTCVVTSGDYERFFEYEGRRYHHIIDPKTGYPSQGCISATVLAPEAAIADAFATALCVLGPERGLPLIEALPRIEALVVDLGGKVHATSGLKDRIQPLDPPLAPTPEPATPPLPPAPAPGGGR
jgi:thiamine biosynthesis lipoprotein